MACPPSHWPANSGGKNLLPLLLVPVQQDREYRSPQMGINHQHQAGISADLTQATVGLVQACKVIVISAKALG